MSGTTVTISASYGAGGSVVAPEVAERLGVPLLDRAIPAKVAQDLSVPLDEALAHDDRAEHGIGQIFASFAQLATLANGDPTTALPGLSGQDFVRHTEEAIRQLACDGAVILGRAGAVVLGRADRVLHVRLDGPPEARIEQAARLGSLRLEDARKRQRDTDRARDSYLRHFYRTDHSRPHLYHLVLDSTVLPLQVCVDLIVTAAGSVCADRP
jgi:cytidylate kinase